MANSVFSQYLKEQALFLAPQTRCPDQSERSVIRATISLTQWQSGADVVWDPKQYVHGNFFQQEINEAFRKRFTKEPFGDILDAGCGDGQYSHLLANTFQGQILGIDSSEEMIKHARRHWTCNNLDFEVQRLEDLQRQDAFDFILSFWCLHWTNIDLSFTNLYQTLKPGGSLYAVLSSFSENSISQTWQELAREERYIALAKKIPPSASQQSPYFLRVVNVLNRLPFRQVKLDITNTRVFLPSMDYFRQMLLSMPFMKTIPADMQEQFIDDMTTTFQNNCQRRYHGKLYYETRPIFLEAIK